MSAAPVMSADHEAFLARWRAEVTEWSAIALEMKGKSARLVVAADVTAEQHRRMLARGETPLTEAEIVRATHAGIVGCV